MEERGSQPHRFSGPRFPHLRGPFQLGITCGPAAPEPPHLPFCWSLIFTCGTYSPVASPPFQGQVGLPRLSVSSGGWGLPGLPFLLPSPLSSSIAHHFLRLPLLLLLLLCLLSREAPPHFPLCPFSRRPVDIPRGSVLSRGGSPGLSSGWPPL